MIPESISGMLQSGGAVATPPHVEYTGPTPTGNTIATPPHVELPQTPASGIGGILASVQSAVSGATGKAKKTAKATPEQAIPNGYIPIGTTTQVAKSMLPPATVAKKSKKST